MRKRQYSLKMLPGVDCKYLCHDDNFMDQLIDLEFGIKEILRKFAEALNVLLKNTNKKRLQFTQ